MVSDLKEICRRVLVNLWNMISAVQPPTGLTPRIIFPLRRDGSIRISEQESRFLFCTVLDNLSYYYSVETPTTNVYQQTGQTPISGNIDLSLWKYACSKLERVVNIEFKAHNPPQDMITYDIEKLVGEGLTGLWFHTFQNIDSATLLALFDKFINAFTSPSLAIPKNNCYCIRILFCITSIKQKWACMKFFDYCTSSGVSLNGYVNNFFNLNYNIVRGNIVVTDAQQWEIFV